MIHDVDLALFHALPDDAAVDVHTVAALCGCNVATVWEQARARVLPKPITTGRATSTRWRAGDVRAFLSTNTKRRL